MADGPSATSPWSDDPDAIDPDPIDTGADDSGIVPWIVVVVRAWVHEGGRVVRMTISGTGRPPLVCYEPSSAAAGRRLTRWLDDLPDGPAGPLAVGASVDEPETPGRRTDIAPPPTVAAGPATSITESAPPADEPKAHEVEGRQRREEG